MSKYYHVTPTSSLSSILTRGLKPKRFGKGMSASRPGFKARKGIYLFDDPVIAEDWAGLAMEEGQERKVPMTADWTILEIVVPAGRRLFRDPDFDQELFEARFTVKSIPPENIKVYGKADISAYLGEYDE